MYSDETSEEHSVILPLDETGLYTTTATTSKDRKRISQSILSAIVHTFKINISAYNFFEK